MNNIIFTDNSLEVKAALKKYEEKFLTEAAKVIESQVKQNTKADTTHTKKSWDHVIDLSKNEAIVGNPLENAVWEEFGTGDYAIEGGRKGSPWYVPADKCTGKKKPAYNGKVIIVYGKNSEKYYKTNGKRPRRALYKAFETKKSAIIRRAKQLAKEELD